MANALRGETPLTLKDGRSFTLVLDMEALLGVEGLTGKPLPVVIGQAAEGFWGALVAIAQCAFLRFHPGVAREDVLAMMRTDREALREAITESMKHAFPVPDAEAETDDGPVGNASSPRGKSSGRNGAKPGSTRTRSGGKPRAASG